MSLALEFKKLKRTGFFPAFLGGALLCAAVPIVNMAVRAENYTTLSGNPLQILLNANWSIMAMLALVLTVAGGCILYHTEYEHNAIQKMQTMPGNMFVLFMEKSTILFLMNILILLLETVSLAFCTQHWFDTPQDFPATLLENLAFCMLLVLPCVLLMVLVAAVFKNMWVSLGIGVLLVFTATMLVQFSDNFAISIFPFCLPFCYSAGSQNSEILKLCLAAAAETVLFGAAGFAIIRSRKVVE